MESGDGGSDINMHVNVDCTSFPYYAVFVYGVIFYFLFFLPLGFLGISSSSDMESGLVRL
jgi:hypothetical protein